jgi:uncharacterized protein (TIGR02996 family)
MTIETPLLTAVLENPDDDAPRLIYADWLDEEGRCDQAEFIRVQCKIAQMSHPGNRGVLMATKLPGGKRLRRKEHRERRECWAALTKRGGELLNIAHNWPILRDVPPTGARWELWRGFIDAVECTGDDWLTVAGKITAIQPITRARLTTWPYPTFMADGLNISARLRGYDQVLGMVRWGPERDFDRPVTRELLQANFPRVREWRLPRSPFLLENHSGMVVNLVAEEEMEAGDRVMPAEGPHADSRCRRARPGEEGRILGRVLRCGNPIIGTNHAVPGEIIPVILVAGRWGTARGTPLENFREATRRILGEGVSPQEARDILGLSPPEDESPISSPVSASLTSHDGVLPVVGRVVDDYEPMFPYPPGVSPFITFNDGAGDHAPADD